MDKLMTMILSGHVRVTDVVANDQVVELKAGDSMCSK
jgi:uncharacterized cupin superfamily protein